MSTGIGRVIGTCFLLFTATLAAEVKPSALFTDHMVLQQGMGVPIWGTAAPGEVVSVTFNGQTCSIAAATDGKWIVRLDKLRPGGPFEMEIRGTNSIVLHDVWVGEVWLAAGQSNMVFTVSKKAQFFAGMLDEDKEIAAANYPQIRMFTERPVKAYTPQSDAIGQWQVCSPETVPGFSAVGYLFARDIQQRLHVPVGILTVAFGGSTAEAWLPRDALAADPELKPMLDRFDTLEEFYKSHPHAMAADAPPAPQTINARPQAPGLMRDPAEDNHEPTVLFNGMLHPVVHYAIRGAIWYQGESIVGGRHGVELYPHVIETLVNTWRGLWAEDDFPFYAVQLPGLKNVSNNPMVREDQSKILSLPNTGLAITIDVGDPDNVHPKDKEPVGERLARIALAKTYHEKMEDSGPVYQSIKVDGTAIHIRFAHAEGLMAKGGPLEGFVIAGSDQHFVPADAAVEDDSVVVHSAQVPSPVAVRYGWKNYPAEADLYNAAGLPAAPFRSDNWDALTDIAREFTGN